MSDVTGNMTGTVASALKAPLKSKKWLAMLIGVISAMLVYFSSLLMMAYDVRVAAQVGSVCDTVLICLGLLVSVLVAGQSAVDWKHASARSGEPAAESTLLERVELEIREKNEQVDRFAQKYKDDDSYKPIDAETEKWK